MSTAGSALNWRQVACEADRRKTLAPDEHASLAHLEAGSARDHIVEVPTPEVVARLIARVTGHATPLWLGPDSCADP